PFATTHTGARVAWIIMKGQDLPTGLTIADRCPVLVSRSLAARLHLEPGATLPLRSSSSRESALPAVACRVVGIGDMLFSSLTEYDVLTTMSGLQAVKGEA